jgi:hypothetical protein
MPLRAMSCFLSLRVHAGWFAAAANATGTVTAIATVIATVIVAVTETAIAIATVTVNVNANAGGMCIIRSWRQVRVISFVRQRMYGAGCTFRFVVVAAVLISAAEAPLV